MKSSFIRRAPTFESNHAFWNIVVTQVPRPVLPEVANTIMLVINASERSFKGMRALKKDGLVQTKRRTIRNKTLSEIFFPPKQSLPSIRREKCLIQGK